MDITDLRSQLDDLRQEAAGRIKDDIEKLQEQVRTTFDMYAQKMSDQLLPEIDGQPAEQRLAKCPDASTEGTELKQGSFRALLKEPPVRIRVAGEDWHVHRSVLRQMPFFDDILEGATHGAEVPDVDIPCSVAEFCLLLQRLYAGEVVGTPVLPLRDMTPAPSRLSAAAVAALDPPEGLPELHDAPQADVQRLHAGEAVGTPALPPRDMTPAPSRLSAAAVAALDPPEGLPEMHDAHQAEIHRLYAGEVAGTPASPLRDMTPAPSRLSAAAVAALDPPEGLPELHDAPQAEMHRLCTGEVVATPAPPPRLSAAAVAALDPPEGMPQLHDAPQAEMHRLYVGEVVGTPAPPPRLSAAAVAALDPPEGLPELHDAPQAEMHRLYAGEVVAPPPRLSAAAVAALDPPEGLPELHDAPQGIAPAEEHGRLAAPAAADSLLPGASGGALVDDFDASQEPSPLVDGRNTPSGASSSSVSMAVTSTASEAARGIVGEVPIAQIDVGSTRASTEAPPAQDSAREVPMPQIDDGVASPGAVALSAQDTAGEAPHSPGASEAPEGSAADAIDVDFEIEALKKAVAGIAGELAALGMAAESAAALAMSFPQTERGDLGAPVLTQPSLPAPGAQRASLNYTARRYTARMVSRAAQRSSSGACPVPAPAAAPDSGLLAEQRAFQAWLDDAVMTAATLMDQRDHYARNRPAASPTNASAFLDERTLGT